VLVVRGRSIEHDSKAADIRRQVDIPPKECGGEKEPAEEVFTVNGALRPQIEIAPGEQQFWRMVNASPDRYLDLQLDGESFQIVALDGMPLAYHDPKRPTRVTDHLLLAPAGRVEAIVTGPAAGSHAKLLTLCVDTGPDGDPNPEMVLADLVQSSVTPPHLESHVRDKRPPAYKLVNLENMKPTAPDFVVNFTEDKKGFYINGQKYSPTAGPMTTARTGTYQHLRIVNQSGELHPFHIHQAHFLAYAENGVPLPNPAWLDTVNVPYRGTVDVIIDFTDPVIKGMSLSHCHQLNHEDKGMMAKILIK